MGYALLWIEALALALFFSAAVAGWGSRLKGQALWILAVVLAFVPPLAAGLVAVVLSFFLSGRKVTPDWLGATLPWMLACSAGEAVLYLRARRWRAEGRPAADPQGPRPCRDGLAALAALAAFLVTIEAMDAAVCRELTEAGAEARAISLSLVPPPVPDEQNAAVACDAAFEVMNGILGEMKNREVIPFLSDQNILGADVNAEPVLDILRRTRPALDALHRASALHVYRLPGDFTAGGIFTIPSLLDSRRAAILLALEARSNAGRGDTKAALAGVGDIRRHARFLAGQPGLICVMIGIAVENMAAYALEDVLSELRTGPDPGASGGPGDFSFRWPLQQSVLSERALGLWSLSSFASGIQAFSGDAWQTLFPRSLVRVFFLPADLQFLRRWNQEWQQVLSRPYHKESGSMERIRTSMESGPRGVFTGMFLSNLKKAADTAAAADARIRLSGLALAAAAFRAREGRYPANLDEFSSGSAFPLNPVDPFDGRLLRVKKVEDGLVLYSVGVDRADNGGIQKSREGNGEGGEDIVFCLGSAYKDRRPPPPAVRPPKPPGTPLPPPKPPGK